MSVDIKHAQVLLERGQHNEAYNLYDEALTKDPNNPELIYMCGVCMMQGGRLGTAINLISRAVGIKQAPEFLQDLGWCWRKVQRDDLAEQVWNYALQQPNTKRRAAEIISNVAGIYANNGTPEKAVEIYDKALGIDPECRAAAHNKSFALLEQTKWKQGFENYHSGFKWKMRQDRTYPKVRRSWDIGHKLKGKRVIVWCEQGLGDEIMFASCLPDVIADAKSVALDCHPRLEALFKRSFDIECHGTRKIGSADWQHETVADYSIAISSLPVLYRSNGEFPGKPYLKAPAMKLPGEKLKIGISWEGGTANNRAHVRTIRLVEWAPLLKALGDRADVYSLQYTPTAAAEVCDLEAKTGVHIRHFPDKVQCDDYDITAQFVAGLDLVISVCTSVVHLAGALGVKCWCLVPVQAPWPMRANLSEQMPWYESVKLIHQKQGETWADVLRRIEGRIGTGPNGETVFS